jgi:hypothetical protein
VDIFDYGKCLSLISPSQGLRIWPQAIYSRTLAISSLGEHYLLYREWKDKGRGKGETIVSVSDDSRRGVESKK